MDFWAYSLEDFFSDCSSLKKTLEDLLLVFVLIRSRSLNFVYFVYGQLIGYVS
jgi:hypothetical protein